MEVRALLKSLWRSRTGPLLVAAQVALALAVVVNVSNIVRQRLEDAAKPTGLDLSNMFWIHLEPSIADYPFSTAVKSDLAYLNGLPGVVGASTTNLLPQTFSETDLPFATTPEALRSPEGGVSCIVYYGTEKFLDATGLRLVAGRNFEPGTIVPPAADMGASLGAWAPEVIVTRAAADKLFPGGNALGKTIFVGLINKSSTIVGIVDYMQAYPARRPFEEYAVQIVIVPVMPPGPASYYVVNTQPGRRDEVMAKVEKELADRQSGRFVEQMEAYDRTAARSRQNLRAGAAVLAAVAALVLAVTIVGIGGLAAFNVTTRTRQLGTRRALGARRFHILRYFLVENWIITSGGVLVGAVLALVASLQLDRVYQIAPLPLSYLCAGAGLLWGMGLLGALVPALRAAAIAPAVATRTV